MAYTHVPDRHAKSLELSYCTIHASICSRLYKDTTNVTSTWYFHKSKNTSSFYIN